MSALGLLGGARNVDARNGHFIHDQSQHTTIIHHREDAESVLSALKPVDRSGYYVPPCTTGTRQWIVEKIHSWLGDQQAPNILWLSGSPGAGKSTIASTLVSNLASKSQLGSEFFCKRGDVALSNPATLWPTIAFDLAQKNTVVADRIVENLKAGRVNPSRADIALHFKYLIEDPLTECWKSFCAEMQGVQTNGVEEHGQCDHSFEKPVMQFPVVILDALDECGSDSSQPSQRQSFMDTIIKWSRLPPAFKLLITSRDQGIPPAFRKVCYHIALETGYLVSAETNLDIQSFFEQRFAVFPSSYESLPSSWPEKPIIKRLTDRAAGLFIWAETVMRFLEQGFPKEQLDVVLEGTFREEDAIDELYRQILHQSFKNSSSRVLDTFRRVIGAIVLAKTPLHRTDLHRFLGRQEDESSIDFILGKLSSVISSRNPDRRIHISHLTFTEFICDLTRCHETFVIDRGTYSRIMALTCFRIMKADLRFNICQIETSHLRNDDLKLAPRIKEAIPNHLSYSCLFGADHLQRTIFDQEILKEVKDFMYFRLLYWLEVLSLLKKVKTASRALLLISEWSRPFDEEILAFALDAGKFVAASSTIISQSTPHIYLSALPFAPKQSRVSKQFLSQFSNTLSIRTGKATDWSAVLRILAGHTNTVTSVAFSQDGRHVVSGSDDQTICIWDAETEAIVSGPFLGHTAFVTSVAFSRDGKLVVSGSRDKTICIWDVGTGEIVTGPIDGHTDWVRCVAFSPDSKCVVSGSDDMSVGIWDTETGAASSGPFRGHTNYVTSVAFSQDGSRIVSGSRDKTIRIWNAETGSSVSEPLQGHSQCVTSVAFSPDGKHVVSGSNDRTVCLWDVETGVLVSRPFQGHTNCVTSVAFSQDGKHIVSGSGDKTVCIWNAETGKIHAGPFHGHTDSVTSVAFAQDGKRIVSGSNDKTIHIWDAGASSMVSRPFQGHTDCIASVSFSHDGKRVVSGSHDRTIYIWDAETGAVVSGPFHGHNSWVKSVVFSPDGRRVVSGSDDETICIWDAETGEIVSGPSRGHNSGVVSVVFSQDGRRVVSCSHDRTFRIWDAETGEMIFGPLEGHTDFVKSVAFSQDGKHTISGSWDAEEGAIVSRSFQGRADHLTSVAFSHDGKIIVSDSDDHTICIRDVETGSIVSGPLQWHTDFIKSVAFSPDGRLVVSGSYDKTICIWDVETGEIVGGPFQGHTDRVMSVAFSQDGKRVVSSSDDKTIRIWNVETRKSTPTRHEPPSAAFRDDSTMQDGWILGSDSELMFWVPPVHRTALWRPSNVCVIGEHSTRLDLSHFVHGTSWTRCRT